MARVSVVLCSYNQKQYLPDAVESVFSQTYEDWELVVVDNGSTDGSQELLQRWADHPKVRLILHEKNDAITARLNGGIRAASGELISLLYSDDFYLPKKLELQVGIFEGLTPDYGIVYSPGRRLDVDTNKEWIDAGPDVSGDILEYLLTHYLLPNPISPLIRRECFEQHPFYEDVFVEGELNFWRFAMTHKYQFHDDVTVVMRDHSLNIGRSVRKNYAIRFDCIDRLERDSRFPRHLSSKLRDMRMETYKHAAWQSIRVLNDPKWAREMLRGMVETRWTSLLGPKAIAAVGLSLTTPRVLELVNRAVAIARPPLGQQNVTDYRYR